MKFRKLVTYTIICLIIISILPVSGANWSWGTLIDSKESVVAPETIYYKYEAENTAGMQSINSLTFNPKNEYTRLRAGKTNGKVYGVQTVSGIAGDMDAAFPGQVVAAVNGDFFDLGYGAPFGVFVDEGKILSSPPNYYSAFGIKDDGTPFIIKHGAILDRALHIDGKYHTLTGINNRHKDINSLIVYTSTYSDSTRTGSDTYEVVCNIISGEPRHDETMRVLISDLRDGVGNSPLAPDKLVISAKGSHIDLLKTLKIGQEIGVWFKFTDFWSDVSFAIGGNTVLLKDGEIQDTSDNNRQPRTVIGIKAEGSVVLATIDGRMRGTAEGVTYRQAAELMRDLGCVDVMNLDGGGSTTFVLRPAGEKTRKLMNTPSGGTQRQVANALVLMNTASVGMPDKLIISEHSRKVLVGGSYSYTVSGAVDANHQPITVDSKFHWSCDPYYGTVSENGVLTPHTPGYISVEATDGYISGKTVTEVVSDITELRSPVTSVTLEPGAEIDIPVHVFRGKQKIESSFDAFEWSVTNDAGSFIQPGKFKAADSVINGEIIVSFNNISLRIPIVNAKKPELISGFESDTALFIPVGVSTKVSPAWKYETDKDYIIFGNRTLKMYYNFLNTAGDVGSYLMTDPGSEKPLILSHLPKKLGMWVYGDGSGILLRSILEGSDNKQATIVYTDNNGISWKGWKYVEANVPSHLKLPITVKAPIYLVSNGEKRTHGCLYFDNLRSVFTPVTGEDYEAPTLVKAWPDSGNIISTPLPAIGIILTDNTKTDTDAGIAPESIELIVNGYTCKDAEYNPETGKISYQVKYKLKNGWHSLKVRARDRFGNPYVREWFFIVRA